MQDSHQIQKTNDFISTPPSTFQTRVRIVTKLSSPFFKPESTLSINPSANNNNNEHIEQFEDNTTNFNPPLYSTVNKPKKTKLSLASYVNDSLDKTYICCVTYKATLEGDISINYSDQLKVICHNNYFALVEHCVSKKHGFVPKYCIITLEKFLNDNKSFV